MKKFFKAFFPLAMILLCLTGCRTFTRQKVGISMPSQELLRWNYDGANMKKSLENSNHEVILEYAENDATIQCSQIEKMIEEGCTILIISAVDTYSLNNILEKAVDNDITVISYDRLIMNSPYVDYLVSFDAKMIGEVQANYVLKALNLKVLPRKTPATIEFFAGDKDDSNSFMVYDAFYDYIVDYIDDGKISVPSGQYRFNQCSTKNWSSENAYNRMMALIAQNGYGPNGKKLDAVFASSDVLARGVVKALEENGYTEGNFPIITGLDCDIENVKMIIEGKQAMSVFIDTRLLAQEACNIVNQISYGEEKKIDIKHTSFNGVKNVNALFCSLSLVTKANYNKILIESGYYPEDKLRQNNDRKM